MSNQSSQFGKLPKKEICKWNRATLEENLPLLALQIAEAKYVCKKCGRSAAEKRLLCKATKLDALIEPLEDKD